MKRLATRTFVGYPPISDSEPDTDAFACLVDYVTDDAAHVHVRGELDIATAPQLSEAVDAVLATARLVVLDLSRLTFIDCTGLGAIFAVHSRARRSQRKLVLSSLTAQVKRMLDLTGTTARFEITSLAAGGNAAYRIDARRSGSDDDTPPADDHGASA